MRGKQVKEIENDYHSIPLSITMLFTMTPWVFTKMVTFAVIMIIMVMYIK